MGTIKIYHLHKLKYHNIYSQFYIDIHYALPYLSINSSTYNVKNNGRWLHAIGNIKTMRCCAIPAYLCASI